MVVGELGRGGVDEWRRRKTQADRYLKDLKKIDPKACDNLTMVVSMVCASVTHVSLPRLRLVCVDMLKFAARFVTPHCLMEWVVPHLVTLVSDPVAAVRAEAVAALAEVMEGCGTESQEIPAQDANIFTVSGG